MGTELYEANDNGSNRRSANRLIAKQDLLADPAPLDAVGLFAKQIPSINVSHLIPASKANILHHNQPIEYLTRNQEVSIQFGQY
ncbi:MAG: hypothetical protein RL248_209 [Pseudomonadota bacterium]|jgi:hypothetical protein